MIFLVIISFIGAAATTAVEDNHEERYVPGKPRITHITNRTSRSFSVHWEPPRLLNGRLERYELQWSYTYSGNWTTRIITDDLNNPMVAVITELEPYTEYKIQVAAYTGGGKGEFSDDFPGITDVESPSAPTITNFTVVGPNSAYIQWTLPDVFYKTINNYIIKWWDIDEMSYHKEKLVDGMVTEITLSHLPTDGDYRLTVAGVTHSIFRRIDYVGNTTEEVEFTLGAPSEPPLNVKAKSPKSTEIHVEWNHIPKDKQNGELKGYELSYRVHGGEPERVRLEDGSRYSIVLYGLKPFTKYDIQLQGFNETGFGPPANVSVVTAEGVPTKPRISHITSHTSTSFYVHWEPPRTLNGRLEMYELQWSHMHENNWTTRTITGDINNPMAAVIGDLEPYTEYNIRVAAYTGGGKGEFSDDFPGITDVEGPSAPVITNFTVVGPNSVYIQWDPPDVFYKTIDNYIIKWRNNQGMFREDMLVDGTVTQITLSGLPTNQDYRLTVLGVTHSIFSKTTYVGSKAELVEFTLRGCLKYSTAWVVRLLNIHVFIINLSNQH